MRSFLGLVLVLAACASPLAPAAAPSPARVIAVGQSELTMEVPTATLTLLFDPGQTDERAVAAAVQAIVDHLD